MNDMRLGDLDILKAWLKEYWQWLDDDDFSDGVYHAIELLNNAPTIDAVPVVRCKDCKAWTCFMNNPDGTMFGNCELCGNNFRNEDDFCSYGERKDGER